MQWHNWAVTKGKPLMITEFGIENELSANQQSRIVKNDATRASITQQTLQWLYNRDFVMILPWHVVNAPEEGGTVDLNWTPSVSYPSFTSPLTQAVWNNFMNTYGAAHSNLDAADLYR